jgi:hypothetical protein
VLVDVSDEKLALLKSLFEVRTLDSWYTWGGVALIGELYACDGLQVYDRDGSRTVEVIVMELVDGLKQGKSGIQWQGMVKEIETLVSQFGAKGGLLTFDDFVKVFQEVL